jgi:hypothetical protein
MKLPNGERAQIDDQKLLGYALNPAHPAGKQHARLFDRLLGINLANADVLRQALIDAARDGEAIAGKASRYGTKYEVRFEMTGTRGRYNVLSVWIVPTGSLIAHLVTVYIE